MDDLGEFIWEYSRNTRLLALTSNDTSYYVQKWSIPGEKAARQRSKNHSTINLGVSHRLVNVVLSIVMEDVILTFHLTLQHFKGPKVKGVTRFLCTT